MTYQNLTRRSVHSMTQPYYYVYGGFYGLYDCIYMVWRWFSHDLSAAIHFLTTEVQHLDLDFCGIGMEYAS